MTNLSEPPRGKPRGGSHGVDHSKSRITAYVAIKEIFEKYSITSMSDEAIQSLEEAPEAEQS